MLKNLRRASVLVFTRRRTLNPKTLNPKSLKTLNPKAENTAYTQWFLQFLFSCSTTGNHQCCSPGKPRGLCVTLSKILTWWFCDGELMIFTWNYIYLLGIYGILPWFFLTGDLKHVYFQSHLGWRSPQEHWFDGLKPLARGWVQHCHHRTFTNFISRRNEEILC